MKLPLILQVGGWAQALPVLAYFISRGRTRPAALLALGAGVGLLSDLIGRIMVEMAGNNQLATHISSPISAVCFLAALAEWQTSIRAQRLLRWSMVPLIVVWILLLILVEDLDNFGKVTTPLYSLTLLGVALWTILHRAEIITETPILSTDWFWASVGLAIQGAAMALAASVGAILLGRGRFDLFDLVWRTRAALLILSLCTVTWGIYVGPSVSKYSTVD